MIQNPFRPSFGVTGDRGLGNDYPAAPLFTGSGTPAISRRQSSPACPFRLFRVLGPLPGTLVRSGRFGMNWTLDVTSSDVALRDGNEVAAPRDGKLPLAHRTVLARARFPISSPMMDACRSPCDERGDQVGHRAGTGHHRAVPTGPFLPGGCPG